MKSKPRRSPKGRAKTKHGAVRKKKHDDLHPKPHECRQQIVDAFSKKMPRLPRGEMGFLLVLPADRRGPARIKHHNMTGSQVVATVQGLCSSLPSQMPHHKQRLDNWISHLKAQRKRKKTSKRRKRPGECFIVIWLAQSQSHWNLQQTVDSLVRIQVPLQPPLVLTQTCMHCLLYGAERSSSSTDGSEGECRDSDAADQRAAGSEEEACSSEDSPTTEEHSEEGSEASDDSQSSEDSYGRQELSMDSQDPTSLAGDLLGQ